LSTSGTLSTRTAKAVAIKNCEFLLSQFLLLFGKGKNKKDGTREVTINNCEPRHLDCEFFGIGNLDCEYLLWIRQKQERQNKINNDGMSLADLRPKNGTVSAKTEP